MTPTPFNTATWTASVTKSPTMTPTPVSTVVAYPNPCTGPGPVWIKLPLTGVTSVEITLYTTAFRKIQDRHFGQVEPGMDLPLNIEDKWGTPLANGLYYIYVVLPQGKHWVSKLMILR
jgi:hypothetical protein